MNIFKLIEKKLLEILNQLKNEGVMLPDNLAKSLTIEPPRDKSHGDIATNAALILAKPNKSNPREIAFKIKSALEMEDMVSEVNIAGAGFVNITLTNDTWYKLIEEVLRLEVDFGQSDIGKGQVVNVEFVSANPTGPLHVGHCRGAIYGDALVKLLNYAGYNAFGEYYINDAGSQVKVLAQSLYCRYLQELGQNSAEIKAGMYPGEYLIDIAKELIEEKGDSLIVMDENEREAILKDYAIEKIMDLIRDDLTKLEIKHDNFFSESSLTEGEVDKVKLLIDELSSRNLVYMGTLDAPKGKIDDDWEEREQLLFRASDFGDDTDRALLKSNGDYTYFASDIAYHYDKFLRGSKSMIDVLGADHGGYIKRMQAAVKAVTGDKGMMDAKICQLVMLYRDGKPVKMSKRAGEFITLRDIVDEVGKDVLRFIMLYRKNDGNLDFDFTKVKEQSSENPVFYVQYAHARICSVFRNAADIFGEEIISRDALLDNVDKFQLLDDETELSLIKEIANFPRIIEQAAKFHEPHRIAFYIHNLASIFHLLWNKGKDSPKLRFINENDVNITKARLALLMASRVVIASALSILGVNALEELN